MVEDQRQLAVGANQLRNVKGNGLFVRHRQDQLSAFAVAQCEELIDLVATGLLPKLARLNQRHQQLLPADRVHLFADDRLNLLVHAPTGWKPSPKPCPKLADQAGAHAEHVRERLRVGWRLALGR